MYEAIKLLFSFVVIKNNPIKTDLSNYSESEDVTFLGNNFNGWYAKKHLF